jgi:hypothetical protein
MANRPIYLVADKFVKRQDIDFLWFAGMAKSQKQKSIESLHDAAISDLGVDKILEISSKSKLDLGINLSAFNLKITINNITTTVEQVFQGSKVFEKGGPFTDLYSTTSIKAKKDERLKECGNLIEFNLLDEIYPIKPTTLFYDWLYIKALSQPQNKKYKDELITYKAFSDIEFNPKKSINCQAFSAALFVWLYKNNKLEKAIKSIDNFKCIAYKNDDRENIYQQRTLF